jgi:alpha-L-rhamnosidase
LNEDPGFHRIVLHPQFNSTLGEVKATYDSWYGPVTSNWKVDGNSVNWDVAIPPNTTSLIYLPGGGVATRILDGGKDIRQSAGVSLVFKDSHNAIYEAGAGSYTFTVVE